MRKTTYIQAINEALREEMQRDANVFMIGEDIARYGGLFRVTRNLFSEFGDTRMLDTPISEQGFMGMAIGAVFTVVSIARSYVLRRLFERNRLP